MLQVINFVKPIYNYHFLLEIGCKKIKERKKTSSKVIKNHQTKMFTTKIGKKKKKSVSTPSSILKLLMAL